MEAAAQRIERRTRHSPTLSTQLMVERCIREAGSFPSRRALMRALPRKVEYPTLAKTLVYLEASNKILLAEDGSIVWVFVDNPKLLRLLAESPIIKSILAKYWTTLESPTKKSDMIPASRTKVGFNRGLLFYARDSIHGYPQAMPSHGPYPYRTSLKGSLQESS